MNELYKEFNSEIITFIEGRALGINVLVIGDSMIDIYNEGHSSRLSPEAPVPVISDIKTRYVPGGASNLALNITSLGSKCTLVSSIGRDSHGRRLKKLLQKSNIDVVDSLSKFNDKSTITKNRIVCNSQQICRLDDEDSRESYSLDSEKLDLYLTENLVDFDAVVISDYDKGVIDNRSINIIKDHCSNLGVPCCVDPKPTRKLNLYKLFLMTPNIKEARQLVNASEDSCVEEIRNKIKKLYSPEYLAITMGEHGINMSHKKFSKTFDVPRNDNIKDVSGCGDTAMAALLIALLSKVDIVNATLFSNLASNVVASKFGTSAVSIDEIKSLHNSIS